MHSLFWKVFAVGSAAFAAMLALGVRFNFASTMIGTILTLVLLTARSEARSGRVERAAYATAMGFCLLLAVGRLLEPVWELSPLAPQRELLVSWAVLSVAGWFLPGRGATPWE